MTGRITAYWATAVAVVLLVSGCAKAVDTALCYTNPRGWSEDARIEYNNSDTLSLRDLSFFVRLNTATERCELPVTIRIEAPDSTFATERCVWHLATERGSSPTATIERIGYRTECQLTQHGKYRFIVAPDRPVRGVEAVGIIIEKRDNDNGKR